MKLFYRFIRWCTKVMILRYAKIVGAGSDNIPRSGPVLLAPNHLSNIDPPVVGIRCPRQMYSMGKEELFKVPVLGWIIKNVGCFPVKRGGNDTEAIRKAIDILNEGKVLVVFPEGRRGDGITLGNISRGIALLAKRTNAEVVPVGVSGTEKVLPRGVSKAKKAPPIVVEYGKPFRYADVAGDGPDRVKDERFVAYLRDRIIELCAKNGLSLKSGLDTEALVAKSDPEPSTAVPSSE